jgi:anti-anti-sigma factor
MTTNPVIKVIQPLGMLDGMTSSVFRQEIETVIAQGADIVLIDLKETTFIDSSGLGALASALKTVRSAGKQLFFSSPNEQVKIVFELTCMDRAFEIFEDREAFEQAIQSGIR